MKKEIIIAAALLFVSLTGCSKSNGKPSREIIESEFRHAWYAIHGEMGEKGYRWKLDKLKVGDIFLEPQGNIARVTITYTYEAYGSPVTKTIKFKYLKVDKAWQIEDRDGKDHQSTTTYNMTP